VDVELVQSGVVTIAGELNLELQLILRDGARRRPCRAHRLLVRPKYDRVAWTAASQCGSLLGLSLEG
jgi:hypothetical protein